MKWSEKYYRLIFYKLNARLKIQNWLQEINATYFEISLFPAIGYNSKIKPMIYIKNECETIID